MSVDVVRYEQVGNVLDFSTQNHVIVGVIAFFFLWFVVLFVGYATAPVPGKSAAAAVARSRALLLSGLILLAVMFGLFFGAKLYWHYPFPKPAPTDKQILAQSSRTAALFELRAVYGETVSISGDSSLAQDVADNRVARKQQHSIVFSYESEGKTQTCRGTMAVDNPVDQTRIGNSRSDRLAPTTGLPSDMYAPVRVVAACKDS